MLEKLKDEETKQDTGKLQPEATRVEEQDQSRTEEVQTIS